MRILVTYGSPHGGTAGIARVIAAWVATVRASAVRPRGSSVPSIERAPDLASHSLSGGAR